MTTFNGTIRVTSRAYRSAYLGGEPRRIVFQLGPGDMVTVREFGRRTSWTLPADVVARLIIRAAGRPDQRR
jgi:hypothetical protein